MASIKRNGVMQISNTGWSPIQVILEMVWITYSTVWITYIRYLMCSKKLTCSQLSPPHGTNRKTREKWTKNRSRSISPVQSHDHEGSPGDNIFIYLFLLIFFIKVGRICCKGSFEPGVKEWESNWWWLRWADEWTGRWVETWLARNESGSWFQRRGDAYLNEWSVIFNEMVGGRERMTTDEEGVLRGGSTEVRLLT